MLFHLNRVPELSWLCWKTQDMLLRHFLPVVPPEPHLSWYRVSVL